MVVQTEIERRPGAPRSSHDLRSDVHVEVTASRGRHGGTEPRRWAGPRAQPANCGSPAQIFRIGSGRHRQNWRSSLSQSAGSGEQGRDTGRRTPAGGPSGRSSGCRRATSGPTSSGPSDICVGAGDIRDADGRVVVGGSAARRPGPGTVASPSSTCGRAVRGAVRRGVDHPASDGPAGDEGDLRGAAADLHPGGPGPGPSHGPDRGAGPPVALRAGERLATDADRRRPAPRRHGVTASRWRHGGTAEAVCNATDPTGNCGSPVQIPRSGSGRHRRNR